MKQTKKTLKQIMKQTKKTLKQIEKENCIESLKSILKPGATVHTILRHVSSSGMTRHISLVVKTNDGIQNITWDAAKVLDDKLVESKGHRAIKIGGCGMDMGFALVYNLGRILFPDGFIPSDAGKTYGRNGSDANTIDRDGGYALNQRWL